MASGQRGLSQAVVVLRHAGPPSGPSSRRLQPATRSMSQTSRRRAARVEPNTVVPRVAPDHVSSDAGPSSHHQQQDSGSSSSWVRSVISKVLWLPLILSVTHVGSIGDIHGQSMSPALNPHEGDRDIVLLNRLSVMSRSLSIGDVILFKSPLDPNLITTKRILALSGDYVTLRRPAEHDQSAPRSTWWPSSASSEEQQRQRRPDVVTRIRVPINHVWVEGDASVYDEDVRQRMSSHQNISGAHSRSRDSREFGPIPLGLVIARVECILWPPSRLGRIPPRPDFDVHRLKEVRALRTQKQQLGVGVGNDPHPDDSVLTPYTHWDPSPSTARAYEEDAGTPRPPRRRKRRGADDGISDEEFDARWRQYLNTVSSGGRLGDHVGRDEI